MPGFLVNEPPADGGGHDEEEAGSGGGEEGSPGHGHHDEGEHDDHHEEGDADGHDHHEGDDARADGGGGGEEGSTDTALTSALRDPHLQEILLKQTANTRAAGREKAKLTQMEVDGRTPLYPGCRPEDTRLSVTLKALEMKAEHK